MAIAGQVAGDLQVTGQLIMGDVLPGVITRSDLVAETMRQKLSLTDFRVWDAVQTNLPGTAATDDLGLVGGTFGSGGPSIQSRDLKATSGTGYARIFARVPPEYVAGSNLTLRVHAGAITTVANGTLTIDFEVYRSNDETGIGTDLCATAAQSINSLTFADKDFTITGATLSPGDTLDIRVAIAISDSGTGTAVIGAFGGVELRTSSKG